LDGAIQLETKERDMISKRTACLGVIAITLGLMACGTKPATDSEAPEAELDQLDESDEGTSYNGWIQFLYSMRDGCGVDAPYMEHVVYRSSGSESSRGGGACIVHQEGGACSSDATCLAAAQAYWGPSAWGYCYSGTCYTRSGSQAAQCVMNPNRPHNNNIHMSNAGDYLLGCMTKTPGPNTACGGSNTALYVRTVAMTNVYYSSNPCIL
jgi:hypothetical protein